MLAIGDSTTRETLYHLLHLTTGYYPSKDGSYPPSDYFVDTGGDWNCVLQEQPLTHCGRDWNISNVRWTLEFVGFLWESRKISLRKSLQDIQPDVVLFGYSIWPEQWKPGDVTFYEESLHWLVTFIRSQFSAFVPVFWLGSHRHHPAYEYQVPVVKNLLGMHDEFFRTRCGGLGEMSITPIERYGVGKLRDWNHFTSPSSELFGQMISNWLCECWRSPIAQE